MNSQNRDTNIPSITPSTHTQQSSQKHCASALNMKFYFNVVNPQDFMLLLYAMERIYGDTKQCSIIFALLCTESVLDNSTTLVAYY